MGKKANQLRYDLYEDPEDSYQSPEDYAYDEDEEYSPISTNKGIKQEKQVSQRARKEQERLERDAKREAKRGQQAKSSSTQKGIPTEPISTVPVRTYCNMCKSNVNGTLIGYFWQPNANVFIPFIDYVCRDCGHVGRRSVVANALPPAEFEHYYNL